MFKKKLKNIKENFALMKARRKEKGFFLLYAVLFSTTMLAIGMGVLDASLKQISISGLDRESLRAFYVADAGIECALYGDNVDSVFSTSSANTLSCNGDDTAIGGAGNPPSFQFHFWLNKGDAKEKSCALVTLNRTLNPDGTVATTTVASLGYNTECPEVGGATRLPVVQRGLKILY